MKLVEVIRGLATSDEDLCHRKGLAGKSWRRLRFEVNDAPGFVSNRLLMPLLNEAMYAVIGRRRHAGSGGRSLKLGWRIPWDRSRWADFIGLDVCLDIMRGDAVRSR